MIRLLLLGGVRLSDADGRDIRAVLQQPKRLALLAYLATARPRNAQRRDSLVALFWPELTEARARASLSQALYFLRNSIAPNLLAELGRESVGIRPGALWCDAVDFDALLDAGRLADGLGLYDGDFMRGLHISDAPEWEKWVDGERDRLRKRAISAAWALSAREEQAGHTGLAVHWAGWAAGLNAYDEEQHRRLLELLDRMGDRGGALRTHEEWTRRLWQELEVEPSEDTLRLVDSIRARTYRQDRTQSTVPEVDGSGALKPGFEWVPTAPYKASGEAHVARPRILRLSKRVRIASLIALLASTGAATAIWRADVVPHGPVETAVEQPLNRIAILPFRVVSAGPDMAHFAEGLTVTLTDRLAQVDQLSVVSTNSTRQFASANLSTDSIGRALNVGAIVGGTVARSAGVIRVVVELTDARTAVTLATETLERPPDDVLKLLDDMASAVAWMLRTELGQHIELREIARETSSREAWEMVARARQLRAEANDRAALGDAEGGSNALLRALEVLADARARDPSFVRAYVEQSGIYELRAMRSAARDRAAATALLDSAFQISSAAVDLSPASAEALEQRGNTLFLQWVFSGASNHAANDLLARAEADLRAALRIHPSRARAEARLSQILYQRGEFAQAYYAASRAYSSDAYATRIEDVLWRLFETAFEMNREDEAAKWCDELRRRAPEDWLHRTCTMMLLGFGSDGGADPRKALLAYDAAAREVTDDHRDIVLGELTALLAASYARAEQEDSARAILSRLDTRTDLRLLALSAAVHVQLGDYDIALDMLRQYFDVAPAHRQRIIRSRLFTALGADALARIH